MKFHLSFVTLFFSTLVASEGLSLFGGQKILDEATKVPVCLQLLLPTPPSSL